MFPASDSFGGTKNRHNSECRYLDGDHNYFSIFTDLLGLVGCLWLWHRFMIINIMGEGEILGD